MRSTPSASVQKPCSSISKLSWFLVFVTMLAGAPVWAQLQITEVMYNPRGDDALWEWIEVRNTSASPLNLDGWVFDDDDDSNIAGGESNIRAENGNTLIPAGGIAVLYPGDSLEFTPARFTDAWGGGMTLIPVDGFTSLTPTDAIGLWPSRSAYNSDTIEGAMTQPRRTFASAAASFNYSTGIPAAGAGRSIAWTGVGSATSIANWVISTAGDDNEPGPYGEVRSVETTIASAAVNDTDDRGNPGIKPAGAAAAGLLITEIMFAPASPTATAVWTSTDFEWVEIYNNTGSAIDFDEHPHVFDDFEGELDEANITSGALAAGQLGVLFNADMLTEDDMETMWGPGNYIPVDVWPSLNNSGGDTIAIWDDHDVYAEEPLDDDEHRANDSAVAAVVYNTVAAQGWPTVSEGNSIHLKTLTADPNAAASWARAGTAADLLGSFNAEQLTQDVIDHPGNDVGSPGKIGTASTTDLIGDYNNDGIVNAADYTRWRNNLGQPGTTLHHRDPNNSGVVGQADYNAWKAHYGDSAAGSGGLAAEPVPEPAGITVFLIAGLGVQFCRVRGRS